MPTTREHVKFWLVCRVAACLRRMPVPGTVVRFVLGRVGLNELRLPFVIRVRGRWNVGKFDLTDIREHCQRNIFYLGAHEFRESLWLMRFLRPGAIVADIGANIGWFTVLVARAVGELGRVYAFEPGACALAQLRQNVAINNLGNVAVIPLAVAESAGQVTLTSADGASGMGSIVHNPYSDLQLRALRNVVVETVEQRTLDELSEQHGVERFDLVKIDVEGAEYRVLAGMRDLLKRGAVGAILLEVNEERLQLQGVSVEEVFQLFREYRYTLFIPSFFGLKPVAGTQDLLSVNQNIIALRCLSAP